MIARKRVALRKLAIERIWNDSLEAIMYTGCHDLSFIFLDNIKRTHIIRKAENDRVNFVSYRQLVKVSHRPIAVLNTALAALCIT